MSVADITNNLPLFSAASYVVTARDIDQAQLNGVKRSYDVVTKLLANNKKAMILSDLLKLENDFKKSVEIVAHEQRIASGSELSKGSMSKEKLKESKKIQQLAFLDYLEDFKIHDPIARNHNDKTLVTLWDRPPEPQSIDDFIDYSMEGIEARDDALTHIKNKENRNNVFLKYSMPKASFHYDPSKRMQYGPSFSRENFNSNGGININKVCPRGIDFKNLQQLAVDVRTPNRGGGYSYDLKKLKTRFSFPNFLLGDMLYIDPRRKPMNPLQVLRPYAETGNADQVELVLKLYSSTGTAGEEPWHFPYDKEIYHLPSGWVMAERADGVIMYYHIDKGFQPDFPLGSYIHLPMGKELNEVIIGLDSGVSKDIKTDVMYAVKLYEEDVGGEIDITNIPIQLHLGLIAYMVNLKIVFENNLSPAYGGNKKKKSKRTNIKKMKKTKRTKRMKRMNMKYMKKSKKNHHK